MRRVKPPAAPPHQGEAPTPERLRHGCVERGVAIDPDDPRCKRTLPVYVEREPTPLSAAWRRGLVTDRQMIAAERWEGLVCSLRYTRSPRSCLDTTPTGHDGGDGHTAAYALSVAEYRALVGRLGLMRERLLTRVAVDHHGLANWRKGRPVAILRDALDVVADHYVLA